MRRIIFGLLVFLIALPFTLSFAAKYYLQHQFIDHFDADIEIGQLDFKHGWLSSNAELDINLSSQNLTIRTDNHIHHGPIIWNTLLSHPLKSFALYQINTEFDLHNKHNGQELTNQAGSAHTIVSYLGNSHPLIQHPGLDLSILQTRIFSDLTRIDTEFQTDGRILASIESNQFELGSDTENFYLVKPEIDIDFDPVQPLPQSLSIRAINGSGLFNTNQYEASGINFNSQLDQADNSYQLIANLLTDRLLINQADTTNVNTQLSVINLDQTLIDFVATNYDSISDSIKNNQWLVSLKHFSDFLKLIKNNQPELSFSLQGQAENRPLKVDFSGQLLTNDETELNPFSLLENIKMNLETELPTEFIEKIDQPQMLDFIQKMLEKGLLVEKHQSYYANLSFEDTKLKVNH